jgi:hypothetical protein
MEVYELEITAPQLFKSIILGQGRNSSAYAWYLKYLHFELGHMATLSLLSFLCDFP